jgi:VanZ family protein
MSTEPEPISIWSSPAFRWAVWTAYALAWTRALLVENPVDPGHDAVLEYQLFLFSKAVHISAYAVFAALSGWLRVRFRYRWLLLVFLSLHAFATEYGQQFFRTRHPSLRDAGLDHLGMLLGVLLTWKWWRRP